MFRAVIAARRLRRDVQIEWKKSKVLAGFHRDSGADALTDRTADIPAEPRDTQQNKVDLVPNRDR